MCDHLISGKYYLIEKDPRFPLEIKDNWQSFNNKSFSVPTGKFIYVISGHKALYIGMDSYGKRIYEHKGELARNEHKNKYLQNVYNKYGKEVFYFQPIIELPTNTSQYINEIENAYIKRFDTYKNGYNLCEFSFSTYGRIVSDETKKKLSQAQMGNKKWLGKKHTEETKLKMSETGKKIGKKRAECHIKPFELVSPEGEVIKGHNLDEFARINNLNGPCLRRVIKGLAVQHKGWRKNDPKNYNKFIYENPTAKFFTVKSPSGKIFKEKNAARFAIEQGFSKSAFYALLTKRNKTCHGWTLINYD